MGDYKIGYKKPPEHTRFKKGVCPNRKGRGAAQTLKAGEIYDTVVNANLNLTEGRRIRKVPRWQYTIKQWAKQAAKGGTQFAELLLAVHHYSKKYGDYRHVPVEIQEWERPGNMEITPSRSVHEAAALYRRLLQEVNEMPDGAQIPAYFRRPRKKQR